MTTATRPLYPLHVDILGQVQRLGGATSAMIEGCGPEVSATLSYLRRQGYLSSRWIAEKRGTRGYRLGLYQLTEKGKGALETGEVPLLVNPPTSFNNRNVSHDKVRVVQACQHHYIVGPPPLQHHRCTECEKEFDMPMTYGLELQRVGARKVRPSERYGAKIMEVGIDVGRTAADLEESEE